MATSSKQNSRFSSLKVFKFSAGAKPPPLPPKDPYYLPNPSLRSLGNSLSPDSFPSQPATPLSAQYATLHRSPSPTPSYAPSRVTLSPYAPSAYPESASSRKGLFKFSSFGKRPKTPKTADSGFSSTSSTSDSLQPIPPEPVDDPSISMPWNFQHNIHVDEGLTGLPPTWSASLVEAGFTEEEISAIQAKRAESRSRSTRSIYSLNVGRSASPAATTRSPGYPHHLTSHRGDDASISQVSLVSSNHSYGSPSHFRKVSTSSRGPSEYSRAGTPSLDPDTRRSPPATRPTPTHSFTYPRLQSQSTPHLPTHHSSSSLSRLVPPVPPPPAISVVSSDNSSNSGLSEKQLMARNAPSRSYHVANESVGTISHSPPPAYMSPKKENHLARADEDFSLPPSVVQPAVGPRSVLNGASRPSTAESSTSGSHRPSPASPVLPVPPRLSLHQDDLSSWTESLFSSIPTSVTLTPPKPSLGRTQTPPSRLGADHSAPRSRAGSIRTRDRSPTVASRQLPPQKPFPRQEPPPTAALPPPPPSQPSTPLWNEVMDLVTPADTSGASSSMLDMTADMSSDSRFSVLLTPVLDEFPPIPHITDPNQLDLHVSLAREKENRDSGLSTMTVTPATITTAAVARSARPNMVVSPVRPTDDPRSNVAQATRDSEDGRSHSPNSAESHSSIYSTSTSASLSTGTGSGSSDSRPQTLTTPESQDWRLPNGKVKGSAYSDLSPEPSPRMGTFGDRDSYGVPVIAELQEPEPEASSQHRPSIITESFPSQLGVNLLSPSSSSSPSSNSPSPISPAPVYPGWLSAVVAPLKGFINDQLDPRDLYADFREIAEGESGSVFAARVIATPTSSDQAATYVAIKNIAIMPSGSPKIDDLRRELALMKDVSHPHILTMDSLYVDLVEDSLWIRMELMERSIADVIALAEEGILLGETVMAQIAGDILQAISYLHSRSIAHRDVRSDNLLVNREGIIKLADFSNAAQVTKQQPMRSDPAGVIYWQAPEIRRGAYDPLKVDVWSLGATVWELAETEPPFSDVTDPRQLEDTLPELGEPELFSRSLHDFLDLCSRPSTSRPDPHDLFDTTFIRNPCGRQAIIELLDDCRAIEERLSRRQSTDSTGTVSRS